MGKFKKWFTNFNESIAIIGTKAFGSIWAFYIFFIWGMLGMLPFLSQDFKNVVLLVSSAWIQLWALPLLAVGGAVMNKTSERRARRDHETLNASLSELKDLQKDNDKIMAKLSQIEQKLEDMTKEQK